MDIYNYGFDYNFGNDAMPFLESIAGFLLVVVLFFYLLFFAFAVLSYILEAIGMQNIAKRRGIHHSWLAWIPVGSAWLLGSISDQYHYVTKGSVKNRRRLLLGLEIAVVGIVALSGMVQVAAGMYSVLEQSASVGIMVGVSGLLSLASAVVSVVYSVFRFIALYDLYASCNPGKKVLFLVLSIVFNATEAFFVFFNRTKDLGMPPRRQPMPVTEESVYQPAPSGEIPVAEVVADPVVYEVTEVTEAPEATAETAAAEASVEPVVPQVLEVSETPAVPEEL